MEDNTPKQQPVVTPQQTNRKKSGRQILVLIVTIVVAGAIAATVYWYTSINHAPVTQRQGVQNDGNLKSTGEENAIANVVEKASPSVVSILTNVETRTTYGIADTDAAGTGIIVSADGYILTNHHVVDGAKKIQVVTTDGDIYDDVKLVGTDPLNDVAYLKVSGAKDLKPAELGDSSTLRVGQRVVAIGNALGQFQYKPSRSGVYTDNFEYRQIIAECVNVGVGYEFQHGRDETLDYTHALALVQACCELEWESLPVDRDPREVDPVYDYRQSKWYKDWKREYMGQGHLDWDEWDSAPSKKEPEPKAHHPTNTVPTMIEDAMTATLEDIRFTCDAESGVAADMIVALVREVARLRAEVDQLNVLLGGS